MNIKNKSFRRVVAILLAVLMVVQCLPPNFFEKASAAPGEKEPFQIMLDFTHDVEGAPTAAESVTKNVNYGETVFFTLPDTTSSQATDELKGLNPVIKPADPKNPDHVKAVEFLNSLILEKRTMRIDTSQWAQFQTSCQTLGWVTAVAGHPTIIHIPISFQMTGSVKFSVEYRFQNPNNESEFLPSDKVPVKEGVVVNTRVVSLNEIDSKLPEPERYVRRFTGFTLSEASTKDTFSKVVKTDGSSVIVLNYERNKHTISFSTGHGDSIPPLKVPYGARIKEYLANKGIKANRAGYNFEAWYGKAPVIKPDGTPDVDGSGKPVYQERDLLDTDEMPDNDIILKARWGLGNTNVKYQIWIEDLNKGPNGEVIYRPYSSEAGITEISTKTGTNIGSFFPGLSSGNADQYFKNVNNFDSAYFKYNQTKTEASNDPNETVRGDNSTIVNLYFDRKEFTVYFHLGDETTRRVGYSDDKAFSTDSSESGWFKGFDNPDNNYKLSKNAKPTLTAPNGVTYPFSNTNVYSITAKYGEKINEMWPTNIPNIEKVISGLFGAEATGNFIRWGSQFGSGLNPSKQGATGSKYISGIYGTMDKGLIMQDPNTGAPTGKPNHLVAMWKSFNIATEKYVYHYMEECDPSDVNAVSFSSINAPTVGLNIKKPSADSRWKESKKISVTVRAGSEIEKPSAMKDHTAIYSSYLEKSGLWAGREVYYFYEKDRYNITFDYSLPDSGVQSTKSFVFSHVTNDPLGVNAKDAQGIDLGYKIKEFDPRKNDPNFKWDGYTLDTFVSGNVKWYRDAEFKEPITEKFTAVPHQDITVYAKWTPTPATIKLNITNGMYNESKITQLQADLIKRGPKFKDITVTQIESATKGDYIVTITNFPKGEDIGDSLYDFLTLGPKSNNEQEVFLSWNVTGVNKRFAFDKETQVKKDIDISSVWQKDMSGKLTIEYVSETKPEGWNSSLGSVDINGKTYYRLRKEVKLENLEIGSTETANALPIEDYKGYIPNARTQSIKISRNPEGNRMVFYYKKQMSNLVYYVHYVINKDNTDYGNGPLPTDRDKLISEDPVNGVKLVSDKAVEVKVTSSSDAYVHEKSVAIPGYTVIRRTEKDILLTENKAQNHIYFYYAKNAIDPNNPDINQYPKYKINVFFKPKNGAYPQKPSYVVENNNIEPGHVIDGVYFATHPENYVKSADLNKFKGYVYDDTEGVNTQRDIHIMDKPGPTDNILNVYMKQAEYRITYVINQESNGKVLDEPGWLHWNHTISDIVEDPANNGRWIDYVLVGESGIKPDKVPEHPGYKFLGWKKDNNQTIIPNDQLPNKTWFNNVGGEAGNKNIKLTAVWEKRNINVFYTCYPKGGIWQDKTANYRPVLDETNFEVGHYELRDQSGLAHPPTPAPRFKEPEDGEVRRYFDGWSNTMPAPEILDKDGHLLEPYKYNFNNIIDQAIHIERIYAVWNPQPYNFIIDKKDSDSNQPLGGTTFTLQRIKTDQSGKPETVDGSYQANPKFAPVSTTTDNTGKGKFQYVTEGYYLITETPKEGYKGVEPFVLCVPEDPNVGNGTIPGAYIYDGKGVTINVNNPKSNRESTITIGNKRIYRIEMDLPKEVNYTYVPKQMIWDPVNLKYVKKEGSSDVPHWELPELKFNVKNISLDGKSITATALLEYDSKYNNYNLLYDDTVFQYTPINISGQRGTTEDATVLTSSTGTKNGMQIVKELTANIPAGEFFMKLNNGRYLPNSSGGVPLKIGQITVNFTPEPAITKPKPDTPITP